MPPVNHYAMPPGNRVGLAKPADQTEIFDER